MNRDISTTWDTQEYLVVLGSRSVEWLVSSLTIMAVDGCGLWIGQWITLVWRSHLHNPANARCELVDQNWGNWMRMSIQCGDESLMSHDQHAIDNMVPHTTGVELLCLMTPPVVVYSRCEWTIYEQFRGRNVSPGNIFGVNSGGAPNFAKSTCQSLIP